MAEFTKFFFTSHQVNSNQVALRRLGTGKVAQNRGARAEDTQYGLKVKVHYWILFLSLAASHVKSPGELSTAGTVSSRTCSSC